MGSVSNKAKKAAIQGTDEKVDLIPEGNTMEAYKKNNDSLHIHDGSYKVITTCDVLDIKAGAGMDFKTVGQIRETAANKKTHIIVEIKNGWGSLSDGKGWIALAYTKR
ncbi:MAG: hypothetical protein K2M60_04045 [Lachnospiraceae bacterium]|nr:hypothetical protein [Lachnospiraceae bacterium]